MNKKWTIVLAALACLALAGIVWAQTSPGYDNSWHVLGAGGSQSMASGNHTIHGTIGQFAIGPASSSQALVGSGYWYGVRLCEPITSVDFGWAPPDPMTGDVVTFTVTTILPLNATLPITYAWGFGDGGTGAGNPVYHTYTLSDTYTVNLTATNACGGPVYASHAITVTGPAVTPTYGVELTPPTASGSGTPGDMLVYNLTVRNTGDAADTIELSYVDLNGWTDDVTPASVSLAPDGTATISVTVNVPASAACGDADSATISAISQGDPLVSDSSVLTSTADALYGVTLEPPTDIQSGDPGETITYTLRLTNTGNCTDTFDIAISGEAWTTNAPSSVGPLAAGVGADVEVTVDIPADATCGGADSATISATSQGDLLVSDSSVLTSTANALYGVTLEPPTDIQSGNPGETLTYTLRLTNTSSCADTFDVTINGETWATSAPSSVGPLAAGAGADVEVTVNVPASAACGDADIATISATSQGDPLVSDSSVLTSTANALYGVTLEPPTDAQFGNPGEMLTYTLRITNTGNCTDTFDVTISGEVWTTSALSSVGPLGVSASTNIEVTVNIPADASDNDIATITVTSQGDLTASDSSVLTTTVVYHMIYLPVVVKNW